MKKIKIYIFAIFICTIEMLLYSFIASWLNISGFWTILALVILFTVLSLTWRGIVNYTRNEKTDGLSKDSDTNLIS